LNIKKKKIVWSFKNLFQRLSESSQLLKRKNKKQKSKENICIVKIEKQENRIQGRKTVGAKYTGFEI
jgi:hypothetical protein